MLLLDEPLGCLDKKLRERMQAELKRIQHPSRSTFIVVTHDPVERRFLQVIAPTHDRFNAFLRECGEQPYTAGQFFETSPWLNLLLHPQAVRFKRSRPLHLCA